jgi:cytochrome c5
MSDAQGHDPSMPHEGPIKTVKQLVLAVVFSFVVPIIAIVLLVIFVNSNSKSSPGSSDFSEEATAARIAPVAQVTVKDPNDAAALQSGEKVFGAQCVACHGAGLAGAPKLGDVAAWAPRLGQGLEALIQSALKGKGAMGAQGGGDFSDFEIARAVVYLANQSGGKFEEPKAPAAPAPGP